jgi:hypothetical protein
MSCPHRVGSGQVRYRLGVELLARTRDAGQRARGPEADAVVRIGAGRMAQVLGEAACAQADGEVVAGEGPVEEAALVGSGLLDRLRGTAGSSHPCRLMSVVRSNAWLKARMAGQIQAR